MSRPNILFILVDDLGWKDLGCYGSSFYETPCIDHFAAEGTRFTDGYAAAPVCSPTRASILTGKYPARIGVTRHIGPIESRGKLLEAPYVDHLPLDEKNLATTLREHGYATWHVGKWHLGGSQFYPDKHGFDINIGGCEWGSPKNGYYSPYGLETLQDGPTGEYLTDRLTDEAIRLIRNHRLQRDDRPFFLYFSHYAVHTPIQGKRDLLDKYIRKAKNMGLDKVNALEEGGFFPVEHKKAQRLIRRRVQSDVNYAAMVENLDDNVGRILNALTDERQEDNTIIIFTSDNGGLSSAEGSPTSNIPLHEGKGWMYDGGLRVPLLVKWPSVTVGGTVCDIPVTSPDFYPTILEMVGLPLLPEQHADGVSFAPILKGDTTVMERDAIYWHFPHYGNQGGAPGSAIRVRDHKLIQFYEDDAIELFNLRADISERNNLSHLQPDLASELVNRLDTWRQQIEAILPTRNPKHSP